MRIETRNSDRHRIRLKGKGVPSLRNKNVRGDHYVTFVVQVPTNLNEEAKKHCANSMRRVVTVRNQKISMILKNRKRRKRVSWIN